jgi:hypothetical protein
MWLNACVAGEWKRDELAEEVARRGLPEAEHQRMGRVSLKRGGTPHPGHDSVLRHGVVHAGCTREWAGSYMHTYCWTPLPVVIVQAAPSVEQGEPGLLVQWLPWQVKGVQ